MDPNKQQPHSQQRTPYISDFVSTPRPQSNAPQSTNTAASPQPFATPTGPQLARSTPATSVIPRRLSSDITPTSTSASASTASPATAAPKHKSFALPEMPDIEPREDKTPKPHQGLRDMASIFGVLASALLLAFCLITFVFQSYQVDGPSMQTTLQDNDHLIVWKVPKTIAKLSGKQYIPNRGDVIIFSEPGSVVGGADKQLIKRAIALPGERITVKDNVVTVYNKEHPNGFSPDKTLPYGSVIHDTPTNVDVTLKDNQVFAMGDNRTNSLDSRFFGPVSADQIVGKLVIRILPLNSVKKF